MQVRHAGQYGTGHKNKGVSLSLLSLGEKRSNVPKLYYIISFRQLAALAETMKRVRRLQRSQMRGSILSETGIVHKI